MHLFIHVYSFMHSFTHSFMYSYHLLSFLVICDNIVYVTPQIFEGHFFFSFKSSIYFSFTYPKYMKIYCSNIFLQKSCSRPQPDLLLLTASREHRLLVYLKGGVPRRGEQSSVVIISYKGYSPPKCTCNDCIENTFK